MSPPARRRRYVRPVVEPTAAPATPRQVRPAVHVVGQRAVRSDRRRLRAAFPTEVWVRGEIQNFPRSPGYHVYFTLVDERGRHRPRSCPSSCSNSEKQRVNRLLMKAGGRVRMTDGTEVRIRGRLDWYGPRGQLQLRMTSIDPAFTLGQLAAARAELLDRLRAEGLLDANRRLPMPLLPLASRCGHVLGQRSRGRPARRARPVGLRVRGPGRRRPGPGPRGARARSPARSRGSPTHGVDVVVVVRGGGAATDLAAFDHELVARAIAACPHPVVTGIGHEVDRSVADEVAHTRSQDPDRRRPSTSSASWPRATAGPRTRSQRSRRPRRSPPRRRATEHLDRSAARRAAAATASPPVASSGASPTLADRLRPRRTAAARLALGDARPIAPDGSDARPARLDEPPAGARRARGTHPGARPGPRAGPGLVDHAAAPTARCYVPPPTRRPARPSAHHPRRGRRSRRRSATPTRESAMTDARSNPCPTATPTRSPSSRRSCARSRTTTSTSTCWPHGWRGPPASSSSAATASWPRGLRSTTPPGRLGDRRLTSERGCRQRRDSVAAGRPAVPGRCLGSRRTRSPTDGSGRRRPEVGGEPRLRVRRSRPAPRRRRSGRPGRRRDLGELDQVGAVGVEAHHLDDGRTGTPGPVTR